MGKVKSAVETALKIAALATRMDAMDAREDAQDDEFEDIIKEMMTVNKKLDALKDMILMVTLKKKSGGPVPGCNCPDCKPVNETAAPDQSDVIAALEERINMLVADNNVMSVRIAEFEAAQAPKKRTRRSPAQVKAENEAKAASDAIAACSAPVVETKVETKEVGKQSKKPTKETTKEPAPNTGDEL